MNTAVTVECLCKSYQIGTRAGAGYATLRDAIASAILAPARRLRTLSGVASRSGSTTRFDALKDVSFELSEGEVLGIVGRNGAGKSTLLKILSRITEPTSGTAKLNGRVACLLEVGTGFHPELTGRENIYLNGAILGMKRREVQEKFEEIVAFSGIERFLETPVKRYSSGMRVRLGFAVAAHLDFEILVVDEVLAVGDAEFQRKCLGRMTDVAAAGRTVIFVSHNLAVLQRLCSRAIRLRDGQLVSDGLPDVVVGEYLDELASAAKTPVIDRSDRRGSGAARVVSLEAVGDETGAVAVGRPLAIRIKCSPPSSHADVLLGIYNQHGTLVTSCDSRIAGDRDERHSNHEATFECQISEVTWTPGRYRINVAIYDRGQLADHVESACVIDVHEGVYQGRSISNGFPGSNIVPHCWMRPE